MNNQNTRDFDLFDLLRILVSNVKLLGIAAVIGLVIGGVYYNFAEKKYKSSTRFVLEYNNRSQMGLPQGLGMLQGFQNFQQPQQGLAPELLMEMLLSNDVIASLLSRRVYFLDEEREKSLSEFIREYEDMKAVPSPLIASLQERNEVKITDPEISRLRGFFKKNISFDFDPKLNIMSVNLNFPDRYAGVAILTIVLETLENEVINYFQNKNIEKRDYLDETLRMKIGELTDHQIKLARLKDQNLNVARNEYRIDESRLQSEVNLLTTVTNTLAASLEEVKVKMTENRAPFSIIDFPAYPAGRSQPNLIISFALPTLLMIFVTLLFIYVRYIGLLIKERLK